MYKNILDETMNVIDGIREFKKLGQVSLKGRDGNMSEIRVK